jgi:phage protein U
MAIVTPSLPETGPAIWAFGLITFRPFPYNAHEVFRETSSDFAAKDLIQPVDENGSPDAKPREWMGRGEDIFRFSGVTFPTRIIGGVRIGGLSGPAKMQELQLGHQAWMMLRGDGVHFGYFFCSHIGEHDTHIGTKGIPRVKEYELTFVRASRAQGVDSNADLTSTIISSLDIVPAISPSSGLGF